MQSDRFRRLLDVQGPYASVYFDDSHDTEDAAAQLDITLRDLRAQLEAQGADAPIGDRLEQAIRQSKPPVGKSGRAVVSTADGVVFDQRLVQPTPSPVVRVSPLPYLVPVLELGYEEPDFAIVAVDHAGGDIETHHDGRVRTERVDGAHYPVHKASGAETPGYGDTQRNDDNARNMNVRAVADRITAVVYELSPDVVFIVGEEQSRKDLISQLPQRVADRSVELNVGARTDIVEDHLHQAISDEF